MDNLHIIFGTWQIWKMLLPITYELPLTGLEWTAQKLWTQSLVSTGSHAEEGEETTLLAQANWSLADEEKAELWQLDIDLNEGI